MAAVKQLIKTRTAERFAQAKWDAAHEDASPFASTIGPDFDLEKLPATAKLLQSVLNDQAVAASMAKDYFRRKFPVTAEMPASYGEWTCDTGDRKPDSRPLRSYPSGHSTLGLLGGSGSGRAHPREVTGHSGARGGLCIQPRSLWRSLSQRRGCQPRVWNRARSHAAEQRRAETPDRRGEGGVENGAYYHQMMTSQTTRMTTVLQIGAIPDEFLVTGCFFRFS